MCSGTAFQRRSRHTIKPGSPKAEKASGTNNDRYQIKISYPFSNETLSMQVALLNPIIRSTKKNKCTSQLTSSKIAELNKYYDENLETD